MTWKKYSLGDTISRSNEDIRLWQTEKGAIEISKDTLAIPIKLDDQEKGYIFHGKGKLLLDTIVETEEGAIGNPVEKELNDLFLMLGDTEKTKQHFSAANREDLAKMGYENQQGFINKAKDLFNRFFGKGIRGCHESFSQDHGFIFAFEDQNNKSEILIANGSKLVYTAEGIAFVSNENNVVLKSQEVICSKSGKSVIIKKGNSVIVKK